MTEQAPTSIERLRRFWSQFEKKTYVVRLEKLGRGKTIIGVDTKYVNAKTPGGAARCARENSSLSGRLNVSVRYAHPVNDLCCTWAGEGEPPV